MKTNILNNQKHSDKLLKIIELNQKGVSYIINKSASAIDLGLSKSEFLEAFKNDVEKTAAYLYDSMPILYSVKEGRVTEINSLDNTIEGVFGSLLKDNTVTLCTVKFDLSNYVPMKKSDIATAIYENLFGINRKELLLLGKAIEKYETTSNLVEKAVLFPSIDLASKLIEKVGKQSNIFSEYRKDMSFKESQEFNITFNRSGIEDVIQNSTYISAKGIEQTIPAHKSFSSSSVEIAKGIKNNSFKYIESVEVDSDADINKVLKVIKQIEALKINSSFKFTLKLRKLGNYNANGLFMPSAFIVAEDLRNTSALLHEIAHFVHTVSHYDNEFVNHMINKLTPRVDLKSIEKIGGKKEYYLNPKEVLARALEIAALLSSETGVANFENWEYGLIKSRAHYEMCEGIYFDFNTFDSETKLEMIELYKFFFDTSYEEAKSSFIDNLKKINTNYQRNKSFIKNIIKDSKNKKHIYALVNRENIKNIIENKPYELSLEELTSEILYNLEYSGNSVTRSTDSKWAEIKEERAFVCMTLIDEVKKSLSHKEYIEFLIHLDAIGVFYQLSYSVGLIGFPKMSFRASVRKILKERFSEGNYFQFIEWHSPCSRNILEVMENDLLNDVDLLNSYVMAKPYIANNISQYEGVSYETSMAIGNFMLHSMDNKKFFVPKICFQDFEFSMSFIKSETTPENFKYFGDNLKDNASFMNEALSLFCGHSLIVAFGYLGSNLREDLEFMKNWIDKNPELSRFATTSVLNKINNTEVEVVVEVSNEVKTKTAKPKTAKPKTAKPKTSPEVVKTEQIFEEILKNAKVEDFQHTKTGETLKVLKIEDKIEDFKGFNSYLIKNKIAYYSAFAKGFVIKNIERLEGAVATLTALYSPEVLEIFSKGRLF